jgi:two-component system response regulator
VILTTSTAEKDILEIHRLHASSYITKPVDFTQFVTVVKLIEEFWFSVIKLSKGGAADVSS